ncbi:MAG: mannitol-1-phosphate 5-dehydrogenase [Spirochaetota bacterium]
MKLVQFGAGNIGRSFIGQLFGRAGWEVVFVDVDSRIVDGLNARGRYTVEVRDRRPETLVVEHVRGVHGEDLDRVAEEIAGADLAATAVGKNALPHIMKPLTLGLERRMAQAPRPLDIIIAENVHDAAGLFRSSLEELLPASFPLDQVGLVETSIGKMVPIMPREDREKDPLLVYAEAYNTLIVDRTGFRGPVPRVPGLEPKDNIRPWVDRKLFIHNMGHAVMAYTGHLFGGGYRYIWEAAEDPAIRTVTRRAMEESGRALVSRYPGELTPGSMDEHIRDLLDRFANRALGDTIYRVGRDLYRKLGPEDRLVGAMTLCAREGIRPAHIALGTACALFFREPGEDGLLYEGDRAFHREELSRGVDHVLEKVCGLADPALAGMVKEVYQKIQQGARSPDQALGGT